MNEEINNIFKNGLKVDNDIIKVYFAYNLNPRLNDYSTPEPVLNEDFITYIEAEEEAFMSYDDDIRYTKSTFEFVIYTKRSNRKIITNLKKKMKEFGYYWDGNMGDVYDPETGYYQKVVRFYIVKIERN